MTLIATSLRPIASVHAAPYNGGMLHVLDKAADLKTWMTEHNEPAYRAAQVRRWLFERRAGDWADMSDLPKPLRAQLAESFSLWTTTIARHSKASDGTEKLLLMLGDGQQIECVLLRDGIRRSICISTQVGCGMGCVFCASGLDGVVRNLTSGEIVEQMLRLDRLLPEGERLSHIVVMGMGEPLANLPNLLAALDEASAENGLGISSRRITISTVGLPPAMRKLSEHETHYQLAVSLHAPDDALRQQLVPVAKQIKLDDVLAEADHYFDLSGRRLTYEYVLLGGLNDRAEHAKRLAALLERRTAMLNVIPYNPVAGLPYRTPSPASTSTFCTILRRAGINVNVRFRKGDKIDAACGQLRRLAAGGKPNPKRPRLVSLNSGAAK
ncbi:MAG: 23S rRNA (adenine(2503)-C(2))-methyltransferase RlmN [Planctomycetota bacterium]|nr:MAG: 23S rRNA (adenine(2503)-C(2))-methyltransferase RlmN [Planctomycetota bacterium]